MPCSRCGSTGSGSTSAGSTRPSRSPAAWGSGQDAIRAAFGFLFVPGSTGRLLMNQRELYDVAAMLDLPARGRNTDPAADPGRPRTVPPAGSGAPPPLDRAGRDSGRPSRRSIATGRGCSGELRTGSPAVVDRLGDGGEVLEPGEVLEEGQLDGAGRAVAVLGDDQLGDARLVVGVVVLGPVEQEDDVGVLLDGTRLAEVGHPGAAVLAVLDGPVELREGDDRDLQLAGERLEPPADLGDLLLAAVARLLASRRAGCNRPRSGRGSAGA